MKKKFGKGGTARPVQSYRSADKFSVDEMPPREAARVKASEWTREARALARSDDAQRAYMSGLQTAAEAEPKKSIGETLKNPIMRHLDRKEKEAQDAAEKIGGDAYRTREGKKAYQYKKGGSVTRGDGIARKGKTKGRMI